MINPFTYLQILKRNFMPKMPTFKAQRYGAVIGEAWFGAYLPKATPPATGLNTTEFTALIAADQARFSSRS